MITREAQKQEAIKRLNILHVIDDVKINFKNDILMYSERQDAIFNAVLYFVEDEELIQKIKRFEKEYNTLVYHVQLLHTEFGNMYSMFYVSDSPNEWEEDKKDLRNHKAFVNVWNNEIEEMGYIGFKSSMGGVCRVW